MFSIDGIVVVEIAENIDGTFSVLRIFNDGTTVIKGTHYTLRAADFGARRLFKTIS